MESLAISLTALEIAKERASRAVFDSVNNLLSEPKRDFARRAFSSVGSEETYKYPTSRLPDCSYAIIELEKIGLKLIPIYVSTLKASFDLAEVRSCIETELGKIYREYIKEALDELKPVRVRVSQVMAAANVDFSTMKNRLYKELQIQSHELKVRAAKSNSCNSQPLKHPTMTPVPNLKFLKDKKLKLFASTAAQEACWCFDATAFNAAALMAGSATEAVLLDLLLQHKTKLKVGGKPLEEWRLVDLITTALKLNLLGKATGNFAQIVRQHRNLIHPGRSLREKNSIGRGEAEITLDILRLVCDELS